MDMDETLILLRSLINGTHAEAFSGSKNVQSGAEIGKMWENHILQICDDYFFYEAGLCSLLDQDMIKSWDNLYHTSDGYTDKWLSSAQVCLEQCATGNRDLVPNIFSPATTYYSSNTGNHRVNVLMTSGALIPSLFKCLLFHLDGLIACENGQLLSLFDFLRYSS